MAMIETRANADGTTSYRVKERFDGKTTELGSQQVLEI